MTNPKNISADELREILAKVDDGDAVKRLMAAIAFKQIDEFDQKDAAEMCGYSSSWASKWFQLLC